MYLITLYFRNSRHGMIDLHEFYNLNLSMVADGRILNVLTGDEYQSKSSLGKSTFQKLKNQ